MAVIGVVSGLCLLSDLATAVGASDEPGKPDARIVERRPFVAAGSAIAKTTAETADAIAAGEQMLKIEREILATRIRIWREHLSGSHRLLYATG